MRYFLLLSLMILASCGQLELPNSPADTHSVATPPDTEALLTETLEVSSLPTPCSIWHGHIVALSEALPSSAPSEAIVTLISLYDWPDLPSALNEENPNLALVIAQGYQEYDIAGWRIPTTSEAKALRNVYSQFDTQLWDKVSALLLNPTARYLCDEATRSFSFASGSTISPAGTKVSTYRLRLVKTLRLKIRQ